MSSTIDTKLHELEEIKDDHLSLLETMLRIDSNLLPMDILVSATVKRSLALIGALSLLVNAKNYSSAASLCRLQLDSCLRLYAAYRVEDPQLLAKKVLEGESIRKIKDKDGQRMTDRYLSDTLGLEFDWVPNVYRETSGFIHLSKKHIALIFGDRNVDTGKTTIEIGPTDRRIPDQYWLEMTTGFTETTKLLLRYVRGWVTAKTTSRRYREENS